MLGVLLQPPPLERSPPTLPEVIEKMSHESTHKLSHSRETGSDMTWTNLPPARCTQTPHISRFEAWESSSWGGEVVALALGVLQETLGHLKEHILKTMSVGVQNPPLHRLCDFHGPCRPTCNNVHIIKRSKKEKSIFSLQQSSNHQKITEIRISSPNLQYPSLNQPVRGSKEQGSSSPPNMFFWFMAKLLQTNKSRNNKWSREVKYKSIGMPCSYP